MRREWESTQESKDNEVWFGDIAHSLHGNKAWNQRSLNAEDSVSDHALSPHAGAALDIAQPILVPG